MKFNTFAFALVSAVIGAASAQSVNWLEPKANTTIKAGVPFTATVQFADTTSSVEIVAISFGVRYSNDPLAGDLGQYVLGSIYQPTFSIGPNGAIVNSSQLTIPTDLITGLNQYYNLVLGEFLLLGADNTPLVDTDEVQIFVSS